MDPELLNLFIQASGSPSGANKTEDLLMSTLIGYITGGLNPQTISGQGGIGGGSSQLMNNYANDPNPVMQQIIQHIQQGTDPYRLSSFVDALSASNPEDVTALGFQASDLKNLALAMNKEYTGDSSGSSGSSRSKSKQFDFSKAGLSNPLDLYDAFTLPLNQEANDFITKQREAGSKAEDEFKTSSQSARLLGKKLLAKKGVRKYDESEADKLFEKQIKQNMTSMGYTGGTATEEIKEFEDTLSRGKITSVRPDVNSPEFWKWRKEVEKARKAAYTSQESKRQEMAVRNSALQAANEAGRTPLADELKTRLAALSLLKKK